MEIWDPGMPPREEAAAAIRELAPARAGSPAAERRRLLERIPVVAWILLATVLTIIVMAWLLARS